MSDFVDELRQRVAAQDAHTPGECLDPWAVVVNDRSTLLARYDAAIARAEQAEAERDNAMLSRAQWRADLAVLEETCRDSGARLDAARALATKWRGRIDRMAEAGDRAGGHIAWCSDELDEAIGGPE